MSIGQIEIRLKPSGNKGLDYFFSCNDGKLCAVDASKHISSEKNFDKFKIKLL